MTDATKRLDQFGHEVLRRGPQAVLPQNLSDRWLATLAEEAESILAPASGGKTEPACLTVVVCNLLRLQGRPPQFVPEDELVERIETYAMQIALERTFRSSGIERVSKPTLANLLDRDAELVARLPAELVTRAETALN